jgi:hypothetical protein
MTKVGVGEWIWGVDIEEFQGERTAEDVGGWIWGVENEDL